MLKYQLDFYIDEGNMNTFLIGTKDLFEKIKNLVSNLSCTIDVEADVTYKMSELENGRISYDLNIDIDYPSQMLLGDSFSREQIDSWFIYGCSLLWGQNEDKDVGRSLNETADLLELRSNFVFTDFPLKKIKISLEDFKKLSILLFKKLDCFMK